MMTKTIWVIFFMTFAQMSIAQPTLASIDSLVGDIVGDTTPGLAVLVMRRGVILHSAGYGFADLRRQTPITPLSIFNLASVSKQMTALAARMQIEAGDYAPKTPIGDILPELADLGRASSITVHDLIHHMSGLPDYLAWDGYDNDMTNRDVIAWLSRQDLDHEPGDFFDYSNSGYVALGSLIAASDHKSDLATVLAAQIWDTSAMNDTSLPFPKDRARAVTGYAGTEGDFVISQDPDQMQGDGNIFSTLQDLAKYEAGFWDGRYLQDTSALFENGRFKSGQAIAEEGAGYGYGWSLSPDGRIADHSGCWAGTSTYYYRGLVDGISIVLLANGEDADLWPLAEKIAAMVR